jgi:cytochrome P450
MEATLTTMLHDLHRARRAVIAPFFSKRSMLKLEPIIMDAANTLCRRLGTYIDTSTPVAVNYASSCTATNVMTGFAFGRSYDFLEHEKFLPNPRSAILGPSLAIHWLGLFHD